MKYRPILFSAPMVRALLDGSKTQTRRVVKPQPMRDKWPFPPANDADRKGMLELCPYGQPRDRLWVREAHRLVDCTCTETCRVPGNVWYEADCSGYRNASLNRLRPSIHMPRWASRITLEVVSVRVERLQDISRGDAMAEGCPFPNMAKGDDPRKWYSDLWDQINGLGAWSANQWVWVVEFKLIEGKE